MAKKPDIVPRSGHEDPDSSGSGRNEPTPDRVTADQILAALRRKTNPELLFWFDQLTVTAQTEDSVTLCARSPFDRDWIKNNFHDLLTETVSELKGRECSVDLVAREGDEGRQTTSRETQSQPRSGITKDYIYTGVLNPAYTFERFVVGPSNQFAHAASIAVARNPGNAYNPLFIYGGVGLGKTHLINAIGNYVLKNKEFVNHRVCCISAEHFTNQVINSIKSGKMENLRNRYRFGCDVLMIDDIQFIAGKESTQEEFFHTFNTLYESKKQIVLTSDKTPKDMPHIEERLRSRFEWGIITDIQPPETETKVAILEQKAEQEGISLPKEVALFIAENIHSNIRELEGCLINLSAYAKLMNTQITIDLAKEVLKNIIKETPSQRITIEQVQKLVAEFFGLRVSDLKSNKKGRNVSLPRQIAMYLCRKYTGASFPEIGGKFGGKDHSTVIHAVKKIESRVDVDPILGSAVESIRSKLEVD